MAGSKGETFRMLSKATILYEGFRNLLKIYEALGHTSPNLQPAFPLDPEEPLNDQLIDVEFLIAHSDVQAGFQIARLMRMVLQLTISVHTQYENEGTDWIMKEIEDTIIPIYRGDQLVQQIFFIAATTAANDFHNYYGKFALEHFLVDHPEAENT